MAKNILLVDDDINLCRNFKKIIESAGYTLHIENTAKAGISAIKRTNYAIALLDIQLPDMRGTEMLKTMHKLKPKLIKIMLTIDTPIDKTLRELQACTSLYLLKPTSAAQLLETIQQQLTQK